MGLGYELQELWTADPWLLVALCWPGKVGRGVSCGVGRGLGGAVGSGEGCVGAWVGGSERLVVHGSRVRKTGWVSSKRGTVYC